MSVHHIDISNDYILVQPPRECVLSNPTVVLCPALPEEGPRISGGKPRYQVGDTVRVNCTSGSSKPAAQLMWFINGEQVGRFTSTQACYSSHFKRLN